MAPQAVTEEHIKATASYMINSGLAVRAIIGSSQSQGLSSQSQFSVLADLLAALSRHSQSCQAAADNCQREWFSWRQREVTAC